MKDEGSDLEGILSDCMSDAPEVIDQDNHNAEFFDFVSTPRSCGRQTEWIDSDREMQTGESRSSRRYELRSSRRRGSESKEYGGEKTGRRSAPYDNDCISDEDDPVMEMHMLRGRPRRSDRLKAARFMRHVEVHEEEDGTFIIPRRRSPRTANRSLIRTRKSPRLLRNVCYNERQLFSAEFSDMEDKLDLDKEVLASREASKSQPKELIEAQASTNNGSSLPLPSRNIIDQIAGMDEYVRKLREMIVFPLLYPEVFAKFGISPPRGVLFYGPPGTGKTLLARLLAESCSVPGTGRNVAFFMKNGSDCLSKWIGEAEKNLRKLFHKARERQPAIIFFDEIDGLAPERTGKQDQGHISLVATLLALMDGLDERGNVVVIGATNRLGSLDPALRRPGRFDREFFFDLPSRQTRRDILRIHTSGWDPLPAEALLDRLADECIDFSGADLKALCVEAALRAMRRLCPRAYDLHLPPPKPEEVRRDLDAATITEEDFRAAYRGIVPSCRRRETLEPRGSHSLEVLIETSVAAMTSHLSTLAFKMHSDGAVSWLDSERLRFTQPVVHFSIASVLGLSPIHLRTIQYAVSRRLDQTRNVLLDCEDLVTRPLDQIQTGFYDMLPPFGGIIFLHNSFVLSEGSEASDLLLLCVRRTFYPGSPHLLVLINGEEDAASINEALSLDWDSDLVRVEIRDDDIRLYVEEVLRSAGLANDKIDQILRSGGWEWAQNTLSNVEVMAARFLAIAIATDPDSLDSRAQGLVRSLTAAPLSVDNSLKDTIS